MSFTQLGQQRRGSSLTSKRAPTRRWLIACPPSIQPPCHTPAISFCPTCTFLSKLPVRQRVMDSSQSRHNGINATTKQSRKKKNLSSTPLSKMFTRDQKVCEKRKRKKKRKDKKFSQNKETEQPMTFSNSSFSRINQRKQY